MVGMLVLALVSIACDKAGSDEAASGDTSETGTTGDACSEYSELPGEPSPVDVELVNASAEPIFVLSFGSCVARYVDFERDGTPLVSQLDGCQFTCEATMAQDPVLCGCDASCALPPVIRIEPGERYATTWAGKTFSPTQVPGSCLAMDTCGGPLPCFIGEPASAGSYLASAQATLAVICPGGACECMPGEPWCMLNAESDGSIPITAMGAFEHPSTGTVEVIFE
jgi:hypothetical protein